MKKTFFADLFSLRSIVVSGVIAAVYVALTMLFAPISFGLTQFRIAEALTVLPCLTPAAIPGLFVGCLLSNLLGGNGLWDVVFGSLATLLAAIGSYLLRKKHVALIPLPPVLINAVVIGYMLHYIFAVGAPLWACIGSVLLGQAVVCYVLGLPFLYALRRILFRQK